MVAWSTETLPATVVMASTSSLGRGAGEEERERVVDAGVGVDQQVHLTGSAERSVSYAASRTPKEDRMNIQITYCGE